MTASKKNSSASANQGEKHRRRKSFLAAFAWVALAPLLTCCGTSPASPGPPGPVSHNDAWLSYKVSPACGPYANCAGLLDFSDSNGLSEASKYYCSIGIDPTDCAIGKPPQYAFSKWKMDNGFPATGFPPAHGFYFNKGDLQLGRDMNCVQNATNVACYVSNYGPPPFDVVGVKENPAWPNPDAAVDAAINQIPPGDPSGNGLFATVAMVFNPNGVGPNGDKVAFYVFNGAGNLINNAALDGEGPKSVPRMCMACHGGNYNKNTAASFPFNSSAPGINFLFFDVPFLHFSADISSDFPGNAQVQEGFRQLNHLVKVTHTNQSPTDTDTAILQAINDLYNQPPCGQASQFPCGVDSVGSQVLTDPPVPSGGACVGQKGCADWSSNAPLYQSVFRPYCRSCHLAQSGVTYSNYGDFQSAAPLIQGLVCTGSHDMPQAEVPFGGESGSSLKTGFWWDGPALSDLTNFLKSQQPPLPGCGGGKI